MTLFLLQLYCKVMILKSRTNSQTGQLPLVALFTFCAVMVMEYENEEVPVSTSSRSQRPVMSAGPVRELSNLINA